MAYTIGRWNTTGSVEWTGSETLYAADLNTSIGSVFPPIGVICAWDKDFGGVPGSTLPECWVECDGSTISDSDSPMDGQVLPNLNGHRYFLKGGTSAGSTGPSGSVHQHTMGDALNTFYTDLSTSYYYVNRYHQHTMPNVNHEPPYYNVVWIMRIK